MIARRMELGIVTFATEAALDPGELARACEERGFSSLWFAEHSHIPVARHSPWQGDGPLPPWYFEAFDPLVAMTAAASATERLRVGTGVALLVQRDPIQFAKEVATLDVLSEGRVDVGVGGGWNLEEMADHGTDPATRWKLLRERVEAVKAIWTTDPSEYHGDLVDFPPMTARPKPRQRPHPPIHVGGRFPEGLRRAVRYGDGWMPIVARGGPPVPELARALQAAARTAGRDPAALQLSAYGAPADPAVLATYEAAGVARALFFLRPGGRDQALRDLDALARLDTT